VGHVSSFWFEPSPCRHNFLLVSQWAAKSACSLGDVVPVLCKALRQRVTPAEITPFVTIGAVLRRSGRHSAHGSRLRVRSVHRALACCEL
jgi:hypothetical protein